MKRKLISAALALSVAAASAAGTLTASAERTQRVRVTIENNTLTEENGAAWTGTLVDEWVEIDSSSTAKGVLLQVLENHGYTQTGAENDYITEINGLSASDGGAMGGYMISIDDWFTDEGVSAYTVESGKLENGDEIKLSFSVNYGADLGYSWSGSSTALKSVEFSAGELAEPFTADKLDYEVYLPADTNEITVKYEAENKAYRAKVYKNTLTPSENGTDYKPSQAIEIKDGDTIYIMIGYAGWMTYNYNNAEQTVYSFTINEKKNDSTAVAETIALIDSIGEDVLSNKAAAEQARAKYNSLTDEEKTAVTNYDKLVSAEYAIAQAENELMPIKEYNAGQAVSLYKLIYNKAPVYGNEWDIINSARAGLADDDMKKGYIESVKAALDETKDPMLSKTRSTVNSGVITALTAIGADPRDFYGYDLLTPLSDLEYIKQQGVNGPIYALTALDTHNYDIPENTVGTVQTTRDALIKAILDEQENDGGWTIDTWSGKDGSDADMTAMALQALAPYYNSSDSVKTAIDKALAFLSENQDKNGMFVSYGSPDCESCAQVLTALCALDMNVYENDMFIKNERDPFTALLYFLNENDNKFSHLTDGESNALSTTQGYTAVIALYRHDSNMNTFFDMTDTKIKPVKNETAPDSKPETSDENTPDSKPVPDTSDNIRTGDSSAPAAVFAVLALISLAAVPSLRRRKDR